MKTLILNGSPRAEKGNTAIFIRHFQSGFQKPCDVKYIVQETPSTLAAALEQYDQVLFFMPLYIHAMPGIVMKLLEKIEARGESTKAFGFVIQAGFVESDTARWAERALHNITKRLGRRYLGTVVRCDSAPIYMFPAFFYRKLFAQLRRLGQHYEINGVFDDAVRECMAMPKKMSPRSVRLASSPLVKRLNKLAFDVAQTKNGCYKDRYAQPFRANDT